MEKSLCIESVSGAVHPPPPPMPLKLGHAQLRAVDSGYIVERNPCTATTHERREGTATWNTQLLATPVKQHVRHLGHDIAGVHRRHVGVVQVEPPASAEVTSICGVVTTPHSSHVVAA